jgi:hypothetical protein
MFNDAATFWQNSGNNEVVDSHCEHAKGKDEEPTIHRSNLCGTGCLS